LLSPEIFVGLTTTLPIVFCFALPLVSLFIKKRRFLDFYVLAVSSIVMALTFVNFFNEFFVMGEPIVYKFGGWPPPVGIIYEVDKLGSLLGALVGGVMFLISCYSILYMEPNGVEWYYTLLLGLEVGFLGIVYTGDAFNLFVMIEVMSISLYGLVAFYRTKGEAVDAALKYSILGATSTTFYFIGLVFLYGSYGTLNMADLASKASGLSLPISGAPFGNIITATGVAIAFAFWSFTFKAALFPNHFWLPDAHSAAPTPISAALSGLTVTMGAYAVIRFLYTIFGRANIFLPIIQLINPILLSLGSISAVLGALLMVKQADVKRIIAYSTVVHIGFIFMGIGLGTEAGLAAAIFHVINHSIAKVLLFLSAGIFTKVAGSRFIDDLDGVGRYAPISLTAFVIGFLAIEGLPPLSGFMSKLMLYTAFLEAGLAPLVLVIIVSTTITIMGWMRVLFCVWLRRPNRTFETANELHVGIILVILASLCVLLGLIAPMINELILIPTVNSLRDVSGYVDAALKAAQALGG